jgi:thiamine biosynthesis lipoprotein
MRIGFGGIGKAYAADKAKQVLLACGIESGIVNASGDLITWDFQPDG